MLIFENANSSERLLKYDVFLSCQAHSLVIEFRKYVGRLLREAFKNTRTTMINNNSSKKNVCRYYNFFSLDFRLKFD